MGDPAACPPIQSRIDEAGWPVVPDEQFRGNSYKDGRLV